MGTAIKTGKAVYHSWVDGEFIIVKDLNYPGAMSVTNDADNVVSDVVLTHGDKRILYYDSMGNLDELEHDGLVFTGFKPGPDRK